MIFGASAGGCCALTIPKAPAASNRPRVTVRFMECLLEPSGFSQYLTPKAPPRPANTHQSFAGHRAGEPKGSRYVVPLRTNTQRPRQPDEAAQIVDGGKRRDEWSGDAHAECGRLVSR